MSLFEIRKNKYSEDAVHLSVNHTLSETNVTVAVLCCSNPCHCETLNPQHKGMSVSLTCRGLQYAQHAQNVGDVAQAMARFASISSAHFVIGTG